MRVLSRQAGQLSLCVCLMAGFTFSARLTALEDGVPVPEISVGPAVFWPASESRQEARTSDLAFAFSRLGPGEKHPLPPLTAIERRALDAKDEEKGDLRTLRARVGISRDISPPIRFHGNFAAAPRGAAVERALAGGLLRCEASGRTSWTAGFSSPGATALRLFISDTHLPQGSRLYVYGASGEVHGPYGFDSGFPVEGFWTHTVFAEEIFLEVQLGNMAADIEGLARFRLVVSKLAHLERALSPARSLSPEGTACLVDASCISGTDFASIDAATNAVAQLQFQEGGGFYLCSGALVNTTTGSFVPYLLTANHCFADQAAASSLEATWRFKTSSCGGAFPPESQFASALGATLLATSPVNDFTLVRLSQSPPAGSAFLGWTTTDYSAAAGAKTFRVSHPAPAGIPRPQSYSSHSIQGVPNACSARPQGNYIYSTAIVGGIAGGSSGSPVYLSNGQIIGQLFGFCGSDLENSCNPAANSIVDGAFRITYPSVSQWLNPGVSGGPCVPSATTICLNNSRFAVTASWATSTASGAATAISLTSDTGYFWFFSSSNVEIVVKVINGCGFNSRYWVFAGGLTNVGVTLTVTDTQTGVVKTYTNPVGTPFQPIQDTAAFAACP